jgi:hypothetical protein
MSRLVCLLVVSLAAAACTRVVEQPPAPVVSAPPAPVAAPSKAARRSPRPAWNSSSYGAEAAGGPKAAEAPRGYRGPTPEEEEAAKVMTLQRDKLQKVLDDALPTLTSCWGNESALTASIAFEVTGSGKAENIRMPGAPEGAAKCVADRVRALALPTYTGPVLSIQIPVKVTTRAEGSAPAAPPAPGQVAAAAPAAAAPPPAPKLFVNP